MIVYDEDNYQCLWKLGEFWTELEFSWEKNDRRRKERSLVGCFVSFCMEYSIGKITV